MANTDFMIEVDNVSMRFNLGIEKGFSLKQAFVDIFKKREKPYERAILKENSHNDELLPKEWHTPSNS